PDVQRFDFMVRERPVTPFDRGVTTRAGPGPSEQQRSLFFALRELTGADPGPTAEDWKKLALKRDLTVQAVYTGFKAARGLAIDAEKRVLVSDTGAVLRKDGDAKPSVWITD